MQGPAVPVPALGVHGWWLLGVCEKDSVCVCVRTRQHEAIQNHQWCLYMMEAVCEYQHTRGTVNQAHTCEHRWCVCQPVPEGSLQVVCVSVCT